MPSRTPPKTWAEVAPEFGAKVRALRKARSLTQEQLAHRSGLSRNHIQNIENSRNNARDADGRPEPGPGNPRAATIWALATALEVEAGELMPPGASGTERHSFPLR